MYAYLTQAIAHLASAVKFLDNSRDPFENGDLIEVTETVEYEEVEAPQLSPEIVGLILSQIKDPEKISNLMQINRTWYREGSRRLNKDREELMKWLRLNRIEQLGTFIRYLKLDRLEEYGRINNSMVNEYKEEQEHISKVWKERELAYKNLDKYTRERARNSVSYDENLDSEFDYLLDFIGEDDREWDPNDEEELIPQILFDEEYEELDKKYWDKDKELKKAVFFSDKLYDEWKRFRDFVFSNVQGVMNNMI